MFRFLISITLIWACADPSAAQDLNRASLAMSVVRGHIAPAYAALARQTDRLDRTIRSACKTNSSGADRALRDAYKETLNTWMRVRHVKFGPAMVEDRFYRFQYWPDKHGQGAKQIRRRLAGPLENIPTNHQIHQVSVALQGFPALERLLFVSAPQDADRRTKVCKLAVAIGFNLSAMARQAAKDWKTYTPKQPQTVLGAVVRNLMEELQIITTLKLARPLGKSVEAARPRRAESWRSRQSLQNIKSSLSGLRDLLAGNDVNPGLASVLADEGETLGVRTALLEQLTYGIEWIERQQHPLQEAVSSPEGRKAVTFLISHIEGIRQLLFEQLAPALGVNLGFNSQDGD